MGVIEKAVAWAIDIANDNSHGYSQASRWGPDYDCSSLVIAAYEQAGVPVRSRGATYTGNMRAAFIACGFVDVSTQVGLTSGYGLQAGDVLLNYSAHTCLYIGGGKVVNARTSEGNDQSGDQSGNEIRIQSFWNYPWNCVLRYREQSGNGGQSAAESSAHDAAAAVPAATPASAADTSAEQDHEWRPLTLKRRNSYLSDCVVLQALLNAHHFACGSADGFFGAKTQAAVIAAQKYYNLDVDGIVGPTTWGKLLERKE